MDKLIEALQIFNKYDNPTRPTHCEHDTLLVMIDPSIVSKDDINKLNTLGFFISTEYDSCFSSYKFGSA